MAPLISIGATTPVCRSPAINVTVSQCPIGASLTKRSPRGFQPLSRSMLVVTAVSSINTRWAGSRKPCSRIQRRRARATSARLRSAARRLFLMVMPWRAKNRESALRLPGIRRLRSVETISFSVRSDCSLMRARICRECFSNGEVLPPRSMASEAPFSRKRCTHRIAELTLTSNCSAASRRDPPSSTKSMTRILNSPGYGPCIGQPSGESMRQTRTSGVCWESRFIAVGTCCSALYVADQIPHELYLNRLCQPQIRVTHMGIFSNLLRLAAENDLPVLHHPCVVGDCKRHVDILLDQKNGDAFRAVDVLEDTGNFLDDQRRKSE